MGDEFESDVDLVCCDSLEYNGVRDALPEYKCSKPAMVELILQNIRMLGIPIDEWRKNTNFSEMREDGHTGHLVSDLLEVGDFYKIAIRYAWTRFVQESRTETDLFECMEFYETVQRAEDKSRVDGHKAEY